jgi:hypothetical protein
MSINANRAGVSRLNIESEIGVVTPRVQCNCTCRSDEEINETIDLLYSREMRDVAPGAAACDEKESSAPLPPERTEEILRRVRTGFYSRPDVVRQIARSIRTEFRGGFSNR